MTNDTGFDTLTDAALLSAIHELRGDLDRLYNEAHRRLEASGAERITTDDWTLSRVYGDETPRGNHLSLRKR